MRTTRASRIWKFLGEGGRAVRRHPRRLLPVECRRRSLLRASCSCCSTLFRASGFSLAVAHTQASRGPSSQAVVSSSLVCGSGARPGPSAPRGLRATCFSVRMALPLVHTSESTSFPPRYLLEISRPQRPSPHSSKQACFNSPHSHEYQPVASSYYVSVCLCPDCHPAGMSLHTIVTGPRGRPGV